VLKWFGRNADDPAIVIVAGVTVLLPTIALIAVGGLLSTKGDRPRRLLALSGTAILSVLASVVWFSILAPWQGLVDW
jgi:hypothetical protein